MNEQKIWLNTSQLIEIQNFSRFEPVYQIARNLIQNTLFSGGIQITSNGKEAKEDFNDTLQRHWVPFASNLLNQLFIFGFGIYTFRPLKTKDKKPLIVPICVDIDLVKIELRVSRHYEISLHGFPKTSFLNMNQEEDKNLNFLIWNQYSPNINGVLRSPITSLLYSFRNAREMMEYAVEMEQMKANPTLITQIVPDKNKQDIMAVEMFADSDAYMNTAEASYMKNKQNIDDLKIQQNLAKDLNSAHRNVRIDPLSGKVISKQQKQYEHQIFVLPEGQHMTPVMNPQGRGDLIEWERNRYDIICGIMGVPKSLIMTESKQSHQGSGVSDISYRMFRRTVEGLNVQLSPLIESVYHKLYKGENCRVNFTFMPLTSLDEMILISQQGIVDRKVIAAYMLKSCGLKEKVKLQDLNELSEENAAKSGASSQANNTEKEDGKEDGKDNSKKRKKETKNTPKKKKK